MPSKFTKKVKVTSPFATAFKSAIKNGTPCGVVISAIAKKTGRPASSIIKSLAKAGLCFSQKFNGTLVCWPTFPARTSSTKTNVCQTSLWQCLVDWCIMSGVCKPVQLQRRTGSQKTFMTACKGYFGKQFVAGRTTSRKSKRTKSRKSWTKGRHITGGPRTFWTKHTRTYKFPTYGARAAAGRYVRAA